MQIFKFLNQIFNLCCGTYQKFQSSCWLMFTSKGQTHTSCSCCSIIIARNVSTISAFNHIGNPISRLPHCSFSQSLTVANSCDRPEICNINSFTAKLNYFDFSVLEALFAGNPRQCWQEFGLSKRDSNSHLCQKEWYCFFHLTFEGLIFIKH